uniref:Retrotransposon Copia-like N-terminal domain-containing protein n=1 Tax=Glycine max TaxID=3847 RepID=A0A0R0JZL1_SOYBN
MTSLSLNISNFITLRLTPTNYPLWREQALALAESQDLVGHLMNDDPTPPQYTTPNSNDTTNTKNFVPKLTDEFIAWRKTGRLLRGWIIGTLFEEALGLVVGLDTAHAEDDQSIGEHIRTFKGLCDNLAAIGKPVPNKEKVFYLLTSLGHEYETFTTTMLKPPRPSYFELISQLQSHYQRLNWFSNHSNTHNSSTPQVAFYGEQQQSHQNEKQGNRLSPGGARVTYMFFPLCQNHIFLIVSNQDQQTFGINVYDILK